MAGPEPAPLHRTDFSARASDIERDLQIPARGPAYGSHGAIATAHPLAALAGRDVMRAGGNAVDAAIAASAVMTVVQPFSSHLGGDAFTLIRTPDGETHALNAGGRAPKAATPDSYSDGIPLRGARAVAVPGIVDAWYQLHDRLATKPLSALLAHAVALARNGFAISRGLGRAFRASRELFAADAGLSAVFSPDDARSGAMLTQPDLADTLEAIGAEGRGGFYAGDVGRKIAGCVRDGGGLLDEDDLAADQAVWGEPLRTTYRDWVVYEQPLPTQGFALIEALNILDGLDLARQPITATDSVHRAAEAMRLALLDRNAYGADPDVVAVPLERLLSKEHAAELRSRIGEEAIEANAVQTGPGDTTSFAVADGEGTLVSFIQSIYHPWGSGMLVPGTGVLLNNRMHGFSLDPASPNVLRPGARTLHTLNTWLLEREGERVYAGGTPGADFQTQVNLQVITAIVDWQLNPQTAIDAPKWALTGEGRLALETRFPQETAGQLAARGHRLEPLSTWAAGLCRAQLVGRDAQGALLAASDLRGDGSALAW